MFREFTLLVGGNSSRLIATCCILKAFIGLWLVQFCSGIVVNIVSSDQRNICNAYHKKVISICDIIHKTSQLVGLCQPAHIL
jgi:hypothetical protein